ncbi:MAG: SusC/RagA family TonB-linked outer membrane protein [Saprospiraceae bacterium]
MVSNSYLFFKNNNKKSFKWLFLLLLTLPTVAFSQQKISGTIFDAADNQPLAGASVKAMNGDAVAIANNMGKYEILVNKETDILVFSFIGYATQEIQVANNQEINVAMISNSVNVDELIVTALGLERSSKSLGYSVQEVEGKDLNQVQAVNFLDNIGSKLAGVQITAGASGVGASSKVTIRGETSFTSNNPLFIVDGIPINNRTTVDITNEASAGFQEIDWGNGAMEVNPFDIASVSVLKGPSAAALYGTRAANGVVVITTKDGSNSKGLGVSFNSSTYVDRAFRLPQFQNTYGQGTGGAFEFKDGKDGGVNDRLSWSWGPKMEGQSIPQYDSPVQLADGTTVRGGDIAVHGGLPIEGTPFAARPDNLKDFFETGATTMNNISLSNGFDKGNFRLSLTDLRSKSIIPGSRYNRKTVAARLNFTPTEKLRISTNINYVNSNSTNRPGNGYGSENIMYDLTAWAGRQMNYEPLKEYWQPGLEGTEQFSYNYTFFDNPYLILLENRNAFNRDRVFGNVSASYEFTDELSLVIRTGMDYSNELRTMRRAFSTLRFVNGGYAENDVAFREVNSDLLLNYSKNINTDWSLDISVGANRMNQMASYSQTQATALAQPGVFRLANAAAPLEIFENLAQKRINSVYGIAKLGFKDFLYVDVTGRNDWSSALATPTSTDNVSFFYPSVSTSFVISNAIELPEIISFGKIRASYAQVGNDTDPYRTTGIFAAGTPFNSLPTFSDQSTLANPNLLPERSTSLEFGADIRFWEDRINLDVTYYNVVTDNQILALPIAESSGYTQQTVNGGKVAANGLEIVLGISPIRTPDFQWNTLVNFSRNVATVTELPEGADRVTLAYSRVYNAVSQTVWFQVEEGGRIGDMYGTGYAKDENGNFIINSDGLYIVDNTLKKLGNYNPDFIIGWINNLSYKNFDFSFVLDWRQGGEIVSRTQALGGGSGQLIETESRPEAGIIAEGVTETGEVNTVAVSAESYYRTFYNRNHEENNTLDASFVKLREMRLSYTFPDNSRLKGLKIALIGKNLWVYAPEIKHFDPEQIAFQGQGFVSGVEDMSYPSTRSFGLSLGFDF